MNNQSGYKSDSTFSFASLQRTQRRAGVMLDTIDSEEPKGPLPPNPRAHGSTKAPPWTRQMTVYPSLLSSFQHPPSSFFMCELAYIFWLSVPGFSTEYQPKGKGQRTENNGQENWCPFWWPVHLLCRYNYITGTLGQGKTIFAGWLNHFTSPSS